MKELYSGWIPPYSKEEARAEFFSNIKHAGLLHQYTNVVKNPKTIGKTQILQFVRYYDDMAESSRSRCNTSLVCAIKLFTAVTFTVT